MLAGSFSIVEMVGRVSEALAGVDEPDGGTDIVGTGTNGGLGEELGEATDDKGTKELEGLGTVDCSRG